MIEIILCEDQIEHQKNIEKILENILYEKNIDYNLNIYSTGEELLKNYNQGADIFILDIQMDEITGMDVARKIREIDKNKPEIIFTTSIIEYIQEGYEVRAYRYLLKPIQYDDFKKHILSCIDEVINKRDKFVLLENKIYETKMTMDKIEKELKNHNFYRCHKSFLVNINYVENIKQYVAILDNKEEILVSRHRFKDFKHKFLSTLGEKLC